MAGAYPFCSRWTNAAALRRQFRFGVSSDPTLANCMRAWWFGGTVNTPFVPTTINGMGAELGNVGQPNFHPHVKFTRPGGKQFTAALNGVTPGTPVVENNQVSLRTGILEARIYELSDGMEFEAVLYAPQTSNVITFAMSNTGLVFHYQDVLPAQEVTDGAERLANIEGSYAVYTTEGAKFGHIYRPHASDAAGTTVECDLNITGNVMTVTVPQAFLDTAIYPVVVDPTFGYSTIGGSTQNITSNTAYFSKGTVGSTGGTADKTSAYLDPNSGSARNAKGAIWLVSDKVLKGVGNVFSITTGGGIGWKDSTFASPPTVNASTDYYAGWVFENGITKIYYDTGSAGDGGDVVNNYNTPANLGTILNTSRLYSAYATYTESGGYSFGIVGRGIVGGLAVQGV